MKFIILKSIGFMAIALAITYLLLSNSMVDEWRKARFLDDNNNDDTTTMIQFQSFMSQYNKNYLTKAEYQARMDIFRNNYNFIQNFNSTAEGDVQVSLNQFADLSLEEFQKFQGLIVPNNADMNLSSSQPDEILLGATTLPTSVDWRTKSVLNSIRNQGSCGSCYTFAAAATVEAAYKIKYGTLYDISEQQLLDCTGTYGNMGCNGGWITYCYNYLKTYKFMKESYYPYVGYQRSCKYSVNGAVANTKGYTSVTRNSVNAHMKAVAQQPVAVSVRSSSSIFQFYKSGIISSSSCGTATDHAVVLVGYGVENGVKYWIVRNSWGTNWGEKGYFRVLRSNSDGAGVCGILQWSYYPNV